MEDAIEGEYINYDAVDGKSNKTKYDDADVKMGKS